jgi:hypothetical protein
MPVSSARAGSLIPRARQRIWRSAASKSELAAADLAIRCELPVRAAEQASRREQQGPMRGLNVPWLPVALS